MTQEFTLTSNTSIASFLGGIANSGGMSMSNIYEVRFEGFKSNLAQALSIAGFANLTGAGAYSLLTTLCEEASLPGIMANSGQTTGVYMGEGQVNYAHTKSYQDLTLGWTCDANLIPLKFLNTWMQFIFPDTASADKGRFSVNRVNYPEEYMCPTLKIIKAERGPNGSLDRVAGIYTLYDVWPYSIQSTPVSSGSSTLMKVSAAFYYRRWTFESKNINPI
jgi:hypothetical protein